MSIAAFEIENVPVPQNYRNPHPRAYPPRQQYATRQSVQNEQTEQAGVVQGIEEFSRISYGKCNIICLRFLEVIVAGTVFALCLVYRPNTPAFKFQVWNAIVVMLFVLILFAVDIALGSCTPTSNTRLCISGFNAVELFFNLVMAMLTLAAACACTAVLGLWTARQQNMQGVCQMHTYADRDELIAATALNYFLSVLLLTSFFVQSQAFFKAYRMLAENLTIKNKLDEQNMQQDNAQQGKSKKSPRSTTGPAFSAIKLRSDSRAFAFIMVLIRFIQFLFATISWVILISTENETQNAASQSNITQNYTRRLLQETFSPQGTQVPLPVMDYLSSLDSIPSFPPLYEQLSNIEELNLTSIEDNYTGDFDTPAPYYDYNNTLSTPESEPEQQEQKDESGKIVSVIKEFTAMGYVWFIGVCGTAFAGLFMFWDMGRAFQICGCYANTGAWHTWASLVFDLIAMLLTWTAGCAGAGITTLSNCVFNFDADISETISKVRSTMEAAVAFMFLLCFAFFPSWFLSFHAYKEWKLMKDGIMPLSVQRDIERNPNMAPPMPPVIISRTRTITGF